MFVPAQKQRKIKNIRYGGELHTDVGWSIGRPDQQCQANFRLESGYLFYRSLVPDKARLANPPATFPHVWAYKWSFCARVAGIGWCYWTHAEGVGWSRGRVNCTPLRHYDLNSKLPNIHLNARRRDIFSFSLRLMLTFEIESRTLELLTFKCQGCENLFICVHHIFIHISVLQHVVKSPQALIRPVDT